MDDLTQWMLTQLLEAPRGTAQEVRAWALLLLRDHLLLAAPPREDEYTTQHEHLELSLVTMKTPITPLGPRSAGQDEDEDMPHQAEDNTIEGPDPILATTEPPGAGTNHQPNTIDGRAADRSRGHSEEPGPAGP